MASSAYDELKVPTKLYVPPTPKFAWRVLVPGLEIHTALGSVITEYGDLIVTHPEFGLIVWQPLHDPHLDDNEDV